MNNTRLNSVVNNGFTWKPPTAEQELLYTIKSMEYPRLREFLKSVVKDCLELNAPDWRMFQEALEIAVKRYDELRAWPPRPKTKNTPT